MRIRLTLLLHVGNDGMAQGFGLQPPVVWWCFYKVVGLVEAPVPSFMIAENW